MTLKLSTLPPAPCTQNSGTRSGRPRQMATSGDQPRCGERDHVRGVSAFVRRLGLRHAPCPARRHRRPAADSAGQGRAPGTGSPAEGRPPIACGCARTAARLRANGRPARRSRRRVPSRPRPAVRARLRQWCDSTGLRPASAGRLAGAPGAGIDLAAAAATCACLDLRQGWTKPPRRGPPASSRGRTARCVFAPDAAGQHRVRAGWARAWRRAAWCDRPRG